MKEPKLVEIFACNGEHSHWELVDSETREVLWTSGDACGYNKDTK